MWAIFLAAGVVAVVIAASGRPGLLRSSPPRLVVGAAAVGGAVLALSDAAPTGWKPFDLLLRLGLGILVPLGAARAGRASTAWLALVATAAAVVAEGWPSAVAPLALGALLGAIASDERGSLLQAAAATASVAALAHLDTDVRSGLPSVAMGIAVLPVLVVGLARSPARVRGWVWTAASVCVLVVIFGAGAGAYAAFQARTEVDRAVDAAVAGLDLLDSDDREAAAARLEEAAASFASAESELRVWWARPALLVPAVAQQARAVSTMAGAGRDLSDTAAAAIVEADVDAVRPVGGRVDLAAMEALRSPLDRSVASLRRADRRLDGVRSSLLLPPVRDRLDDLAERISEARGSAESAAEAVAVAPGLLGGEGPRRYFLALQTPSELRGVGGFMGSWAELVIDGGRFDLVRTGRLGELTESGADPAGRRIEGNDEFVDRYGQSPAHYLGLVGFSPDFPTVGGILAQLYPDAGGSEVDGVVALDPSAFASLLELTGPIAVPGYPGELTPEAAEQTLLFDQYLTFPKERGPDREQFLADATQVLFDALTGGELPGPGAIAATLGPAVDGRHLQLFSTHAAEQRFFERIGAAGSVRRASGDAVGLVSQNFNGNKIDWFLRRALSYDLTWNPGTGEITGTLEARVTNEAPASGLPASIISWGGDVSLGQSPVADGENFMELSLFSALPLQDITVDGSPLDPSRSIQLGMEEAHFYLRVPSQTTSVVRARVEARVDPGSEYVLRLVRQATVVPDDVEVRIRLAPGWTATSVTGGDSTDDGAAATWTAEVPQELRLRVVRDEDRSLVDRLRDR